jgi:hypothetical protein
VTSSTPILDAALGYARRGIPVFPVWCAVPFHNGSSKFVCGCGRLNCVSPAKHPLAKAVPHGLSEASTDEVRVRSFFSNYPDANIGGVMSAAVIAIDIDPQRGGDVSALEKIHGVMPRTWRVRTGSGGEHIYFSTTAAIHNSYSKLAKGIDVRGQGGYTVLPPSVHITGNRYEWQLGCAPRELSLAPLPPSIAAALNEPTKQTVTGSDWVTLASTDVVEGGRNSTIARFAGHLLRHYVDPLVAVELLLAWNATRCKPPLDHAEVVRTINSIAGAELRRRSQI